MSVFRDRSSNLLFLVESVSRIWSGGIKRSLEKTASLSQGYQGGRCNQNNSIQFVDHVLSKLPFQVHSIQTDNGSEFGPQFHWHILDKGIEHRYIKPRSPRLNGKVERSHRIDEEEFYRMLQGVVIDNSELFNERLQQWENFYNFQRSHGSLGGRSPFERLQEKLKELSLTGDAL